MAAPRKWLRLDSGWSSSEWLAELEPAARLAWVELLCYAKNEGVAGTVKKMSPAVFGRRFGIPAEDVRAMLDAAIDHGAVELDDDSWVVTQWATYQPKDATAAARMRKYRNEKSAHSPLRRVTGRYGVTDAVTGERPRNPSRATKTTVNEDHKQKTDAYASGAEPRVMTPEEHAYARLAPLIRQHLWRGSKPPANRKRDGPWSMSRELKLAIGLMTARGIDVDEMAEVIEHARAVLKFSSDEPLTLRIFNVNGRGDRLEDVRQYVRKRRERELGEKGLERLDKL